MDIVELLTSDRTLCETEALRSGLCAGVLRGRAISLAVESGFHHVANWIVRLDVEPAVLVRAQLQRAASTLAGFSKCPECPWGLGLLAVPSGAGSCRN